MNRHLVRILAPAVLFGLFAGCGGGSSAPKDRPATTKVSGKVIFKGQPLEGATVSLMSPTGGPAAMGLTDASGGYKLTTFEKDDGAVPGDYKVTIRKMDKAAASGVSMDDPNYNPNAVEVPPRSLIPEKYGDQLKSGLTATIGKDAKSDLNFTLE
jgi:hypothetical protein